MSDRRVAVTGVGPVSAIGIGKEAFFAALGGGESGIDAITAFDTEGYPSHLAAEVLDFDVEEYLESQKTYLDRASELALAAVGLALEDADLDLRGDDAEREGCDLLLGSAYGSLETMALFFEDFVRKGARFVKPFLFPHTYSNTAISLAAIEYGLNGYQLNFSAGCVSASHALLEAYDRIRTGRSQRALAGGYESLNEVLFAGLSRLNLLSPCNGGEEVCAPFDRDRNGFVLGEGSAVLVLEDLERALARKAHVYGEIKGAGAFSDSVSDGAGAAVTSAMQAAVDTLPPDDRHVDIVSANANGSDLLDRREARGIAAFIKTSGATPLVSSIKSMVGETLGASGALQMVAAVAALENGGVPPTVNLRTPERDLGLNLLSNGTLEKSVNRVLTNAVDPGGSVVSFALEKARPAQ